MNNLKLFMFSETEISEAKCNINLHRYLRIRKLFKLEQTLLRKTFFYLL